ncbi:hypothetical protein ALC53_11316 [Atta colombica]|uniref:Mos1 transposase HTH domain-containing protein n=1 Tax=Atta colombica TaxID=520822 RepID=A0A151HZT1_9HYME|nr:hypothetical protein ALC53_11316 [Atta colombica]
MSSFEPNKRHLRELLIYFSNLKKSAAEAHRLLVGAYDYAALSERSYREFQKTPGKIILLHDNADHITAPVKTYLETLKLSEQHFTSYEDTKNCIDDWIASKDEAFFDGVRDGISRNIGSHQSISFIGRGGVKPKKSILVSTGFARYGGADLKEEKEGIALREEEGNN